jgi:hypothetical protein
MQHQNKQQLNKKGLGVALLLALAMCGYAVLSSFGPSGPSSPQSSAADTQADSTSLPGDEQSVGHGAIPEAAMLAAHGLAAGAGMGGDAVDPIPPAVEGGGGARAEAPPRSARHNDGGRGADPPEVYELAEGPPTPADGPAFDGTGATGAHSPR